jgi:hypothetical protein
VGFVRGELRGRESRIATALRGGELRLRDIRVPGSRSALALHLSFGSPARTPDLKWDRSGLARSCRGTATSTRRTRGCCRTTGRAGSCSSRRPCRARGAAHTRQCARGAWLCSAARVALLRRGLVLIVAVRPAFVLRDGKHRKSSHEAEANICARPAARRRARARRALRRRLDRPDRAAAGGGGAAGGARRVRGRGA